MDPERVELNCSTDANILLSEGGSVRNNVCEGHPEHLSTANGLQYNVDENPSWNLSILLGLQHYLTMFGGVITLPFILAPIMCFENQTLVIAELINTLFFACGVSTLLQVTFGSRLPLIQGVSFSFIGPSASILNLPKYQCPSGNEVTGNISIKGISGMLVQGNSSSWFNSTMTTHQGMPLDDWTVRMNVICGSVMVASLFQVIVGFSGIVGIFLRFIGPLPIGTMITLVGIHLYQVAVNYAGTNWMVAGITLILMLICSLYFAEIPIPIPWCIPGKRAGISWFKAFKLFPVFIAVVISWILCAILTAANVFPDDPTNPGYLARADARIGVLKEAKWFRIPYPGQWGIPVVTVAGVFGVLPAVLTSIVGSVGDYYACARLCNLPLPPRHAINRGIGLGGICSLIGGALGIGSGIVSYSENVAAIGITKVGSRRVIQCAALMMMVCGLFGKFGALFTTLPTPVIGGIFIVLFGLIAAVGVSSLQSADTRSVRNLTIFGVSIMAGMGIPHWFKTHRGVIQTGNLEGDQIISVLLTTEIAVGGIIALFLDNTVKGSLAERGIIGLDEGDNMEGNTASLVPSLKVYDLPNLIQKRINAVATLKRFPCFAHHQTS